MSGTNAGYLILEDGRRFAGRLAGAVPEGLTQRNEEPGIGEVVFQTGMTGYQEVITDPSYRGQIVTFTAPHIGNVGANRQDDEAPEPALAGIVCRDLCESPSNWRSEGSLPEFLREHGIPCLTEVDTRALTRHIRTAGALRGVMVPQSVDAEVALARVRAFPGLSGRNLVDEVAPTESMTGFEGLDAVVNAAPPELADEFPLADGASLAGKRIVVVHCGMKEGIDQALRRRGAKVRLVTPNASAEEILAGEPDGLLLSNGPGDPVDVATLIRTLPGLFGKLPILGICLGHQVLALALGAKTYKMKFGHHGINHPVKDLRTGRVMVTSQNHGFAVDGDSLGAALGGDVQTAPQLTHVSLNDETCEGFAVPELRIQAVQFHPEACAGPMDARGIIGIELNVD